ADQAGAVIASLRAELKGEAERRATAEEKAGRVPGLEASLAERERDSARLHAALAALSTLVAEERKAADEKLAILEEARTKLSDAFMVLSAEALKRNNQSFLDLAKTSLE